MREILFKAKGRDNGKWVEGYYVLCRECHYILPIFNNDALYHGYDERYDEWIEIEPSTVCQYTGLTDKNGRKIWENDILEQSTSKKHWCQWTCFGIVRYGEFDFRPGNVGFKTNCFYVERLNIGTEYTAIHPGINQYDILEENYPSKVIGNVFDNPDLLNPQN